MTTTKPNVIIIITDDQGYGDLACHGNPVAQTPNLDQLHGESVRLTDFHAAPMCTPTRGQLLTGLDAARNGAVNVSSGRTLLRADLPTMADLFKANGYRTGLFGNGIWVIIIPIAHRIAVLRKASGSRPRTSTRSPTTGRTIILTTPTVTTAHGNAMRAIVPKSFSVKR